MSPAPKVILLDSCAYFRLARTIRPLLAVTFGHPPPFSLFVLEVLDKEYLSNSRLRNKFEWLNQDEFREDRLRKRYNCKGKWASEAELAFSYLDAYAKSNKLTLAPEDLKALAAGIVRQIPVVSDDGDLCRTAEAHGIECWGTLKLLKIMKECGRISQAKVHELLDYLDQENDLPMGKATLRKQYAELFGEPCPI